MAQFRTLLHQGSRDALAQPDQIRLDFQTHRITGDLQTGRTLESLRNNDSLRRCWTLLVRQGPGRIRSAALPGSLK